jgi:hypothetical protein
MARQMVCIMYEKNECDGTYTTGNPCRHNGVHYEDSGCNKACGRGCICHPLKDSDGELVQW